MGIQYGPVDVVVLTVIPAELEAAQKALGISDHYRTKDANGTVYLFGSVYSERAKRFYRVALSCIAAAGNSGASAATTSAIESLSPRTVLLMGIAAGIRDQVRIGEVVLAERVVAYESAAHKVDRQGTPYNEPRPEIERWSHTIAQDVATFSPNRARLQETFRRAGGASPATSWEADRHIAREVSIRTVTLASGEKLLRDPAKISGFKSIHGKIEAGEMEAAGFAEACRRHSKPWLVIRGISDFGDASKDDSFHPFASCAAAAVLLEFLICGLDLVERRSRPRPPLSDSMLADPEWSPAPRLTFNGVPRARLSAAQMISGASLIAGGGLALWALECLRSWQHTGLVTVVTVGTSATLETILRATTNRPLHSIAISAILGITFFATLSNASARDQCISQRSCTIFLRATEHKSHGKGIPGATFHISTRLTALPVRVAANEAGEASYRAASVCDGLVSLSATASSYAASAHKTVQVADLAQLEIELDRLPIIEKPRPARTPPSSSKTSSPPLTSTTQVPLPEQASASISGAQDLARVLEQVDTKLQLDATSHEAARMFVETLRRISAIKDVPLACQSLRALRRYASGPCEHLLPSALRSARGHLPALTQLCPREAFTSNELNRCSLSID